jgi:hypothetical protein
MAGLADDAEELLRVTLIKAPSGSFGFGFGNDPNTGELLVTGVWEPPAHGRLAVGDVIVKLNGYAGHTLSADDVLQILRPASVANFTILRPWSGEEVRLEADAYVPESDPSQMHDPSNPSVSPDPEAADPTVGALQHHSNNVSFHRMHASPPCLPCWAC